MSDAMDTDQVLGGLYRIHDAIEDAACELARKEARLAHITSRVLPQSKDEHELMVVTATMEAYAEDVVNGKNQKTRDAQLAAYMGNHEGVARTLKQLRYAETRVATLEMEAAQWRRNYTIATNRLWALRAMAELYAARLNAAAGVECQSQVHLGKRGERAR